MQCMEVCVTVFSKSQLDSVSDDFSTQARESLSTFATLELGRHYTFLTARVNKLITAEHFCLPW